MHDILQNNTSRCATQVPYINNKERNSSVELLRIIAMFLIVQSHFAVHGYMALLDGSLSAVDNSFNRFLITAMTTGNIGNGLFMLITGYFMSTSKEFKKSRLVRIFIQVLLYSLLCYVVYTCVFGDYVFNLKDIFVAITPLSHDTYWYFSSYVLILLFYPFINILTNELNQKKLGLLICLMSVVWGIIPSVTGRRFQGSSFLVFCNFYLIGAYIKKYYVKGLGFISYDNISLFNKKNIQILTYVSIILWFVLALITAYFTPFYRIVYMGSPLVFLLSIFLFLLFINNNINYSRIINVTAGCVAGVYLLSDNPYIRSILYSRVFKVDRFLESNTMLLHILLFSLITLILCVLIEFVRSRLFDSLFKLLINSRKGKEV